MKVGYWWEFKGEHEGTRVLVRLSSVDYFNDVGKNGAGENLLEINFKNKHHIVCRSSLEDVKRLVALELKA